MCISAQLLSLVIAIDSSPKRELELGFDETGNARLFSRSPFESWPLFRDDFAGAAQLGRKVLELGESVPHAQHRFGVIDVNAGSEGKRRDRGGEHVNQS